MKKIEKKKPRNALKKLLITYPNDPNIPNIHDYEVMLQ